ncbi:sugar transferase [Desulfovibrio psychrotolerans]|uniref:Bacterial sugar transferase domain-containing protein n=1 Tax=Desulfovibrio psychrotolerans TaxID=415242 RepID=A0A7J0BTX3_9BACT|nr:sugar transferase [Desulfovibrio psychrotolerans]GFM36585.1 hypothetical protein DSM19430T_12690 [Desulfovibrio psychrotolerans]
MHVTLTGGDASFFTTEAAPLLRAMREAGHSVTVMAPRFDARTTAALTAMGVDTHTFASPREGIIPLRNAVSVFSLWRAFRARRSDTVLNCGVPCIIHGSLAAHLAGTRRIFALVNDAASAFPGHARTLLADRSILAETSSQCPAGNNGSTAEDVPAARRSAEMTQAAAKTAQPWADDTTLRPAQPSAATPSSPDGPYGTGGTGETDGTGNTGGTDETNGTELNLQTQQTEQAEQTELEGQTEPAGQADSAFAKPLRRARKALITRADKTAAESDTAADPHAPLDPDALAEQAGYAGRGQSFVRLAKATFARLAAHLRTRFRVASCKAALSANRTVFFLNSDDRTIFTKGRILPVHTRHCLTSGFGVDIQAHAATPLPDTSPGMEFLCIARLTRLSGVEEFAEAARLVRQQYPESRFRLIGQTVEDPMALSPSDLSLWKMWLTIEPPDSVAPDASVMERALAGATVFVLPSVHEAMPAATLRALAAGRPVITTDAPGCRETVLHCANGYLVPPRNAQSLAEAMLRCIREPQILPAMGEASRRYAEERFDMHKATRPLLREMHLAHAGPETVLPQTVLSSAVKRAFDLVLAVPLCVLLLPVMAVVAWKVRTRISKDVFFRQERPGKEGKLFRILKFKTMTDAVDEHGALLPDADRLPLLGKRLRAASLDELPELWNVIRGEMSLVGPRPLLPSYLERYSPRQARRHEVRPGITGWAQVNGRNSASWQERLEMDVWYVDNHSLWLDMRILFLTVWNVLRRKDISAPGHATCPEFMGNDPSAACPGMPEEEQTTGTSPASGASSASPASDGSGSHGNSGGTQPQPATPEDTATQAAAAADSKHPPEKP